MNCMELSVESLENKCEKWAGRIKEEYRPDALVYVAKAGYLIARPMTRVFNVPVIGVEAVRSGNGIKKLAGPLLSVMPNFVRNMLISAELKTGVHGKKSERKVEFHEGKNSVKAEDILRILVVDDSVDTGHSMSRVVERVKEEFPNAEVRTAALNVWDKSESVIETDYALYRNVIIKAPMSKDSKEYKKFIRIYDDETRHGFV